MVCRRWKATSKDRSVNLKQACLTFFCSVISAWASQSPLYDASQELLQHLTSSRYEHKAVIDESRGTYALDCSLFIGHLIKKVSPKAYSALPIDAPHKRARAKNFYDFFTSLKASSHPNWIPLFSMNSLEQGDIIAWKYDPNLGKKDTGHVVMVYEKPIKEADGRYKIVVLDSSKGTHAHDSRAQQKEGGIGTGTMWFHVDKDDKPIGLYWSDRSAKMSSHAIAMGRVVR